MARNRLARMAAIHIRVMPALRLEGALKAVIPFEIASTPVRAAVPLEKACKIKKMLTTLSVVVPAVIGGGLGTNPRLPVTKRNRPMPTVRDRSAMEKKVGMGKGKPGSFT